MIRIFKHYVPKPVFILGFVELLILAGAIVLGLTTRFSQLGMGVSYGQHWGAFLAFVAVVMVSLVAVGLYQSEAYRDVRVMVIRLLTSALLSLVVMSVVSFVLPDVDIWRSVFAYGLGYSVIGIFVSRMIFSRIADLDQLKRTVILLGAGKRARRIKEMEREASGPGFRTAATIRMAPTEVEFPEAPDFETVRPLVDFALDLQAEEIVVASEERRGTLPVEDLLACKMEGIKVTDATTFIEQQTGAVDLESVSPSWLIFSDGFGRSGRFDLFLKRLFDVTTSLLLLLLTLPILIVTAIAIKVTSPGPVFYRQERVGQGGRTFMVLKFRSMRTDAERNGPQWAQANDDRVTPVGRLIRTARIDEIPQIFNVLKGDMSFVGPRPERPVFVEQLAKEIPFYLERHRVKPGITGWAQINYPYGASVEDARHKLQYDLYYIKNYSIFLDFLVLIQTLRVVLWPEGAR